MFVSPFGLEPGFLNDFDLAPVDWLLHYIVVGEGPDLTKHVEL
jgi:hypothetical protein